MKIIKNAILKPGHNHEALGGLFEVTYEGGDTDWVYAETFYGQVPEWNNKPENLIGKEIDVEDFYFNI